MKRSILVVDQSLDYCRWVTHALNGPMTEVLSALSTDEAIKFYTKYRFCLVIIDGVLAEQNKTRLLKILRETRVSPVLHLKNARSSYAAARPPCWRRAVWSVSWWPRQNP